MVPADPALAAPKHPVPDTMGSARPRDRHRIQRSQATLKTLCGSPGAFGEQGYQKPRQALHQPGGRGFNRPEPSSPNSISPPSTLPPPQRGGLPGSDARPGWGGETQAPQLISEHSPRGRPTPPKPSSSSSCHLQQPRGQLKLCPQAPGPAPRGFPSERHREGGGGLPWAQVGARSRGSAA